MEITRNREWCHSFGGFHSHGGTPIAGCFKMENPTEMDDLGGNPMVGPPPYMMGSCCMLLYFWGTLGGC